MLWKLNLALFLTILSPPLYFHFHFCFHLQFISFSLFMICSPFLFPSSVLPPIEMGSALTFPLHPVSRKNEALHSLCFVGLLLAHFTCTTFNCLPCITILIPLTAPRASWRQRNNLFPSVPQRQTYTFAQSRHSKEVALNVCG